jgi:hypothetical protein
MEHSFYLTVRIVVAVYLLYKVWNLLFRDRLFGLWDKIPVKEKRPTAPKEAKPAERRQESTVLGRTNKILLEDPRKAVPEPVATTDLEPTGFIGRDEPLPADDVEAPEPPYIPSDEELEETPLPDENGMSSGVTFDELSNVVEVLKTGLQDEARRMEAAITLNGIRETKLMDYILCEVCRADTVENLFKECLDGDGFPLKKRNPLEGFDMRKYV